MRFGPVTGVPNEYSRFGRILNEEQSGLAYTTSPQVLERDGLEDDDDAAFKVEIWENDSGLIYYAEED